MISVRPYSRKGLCALVFVLLNNFIYSHATAQPLVPRADVPLETDPETKKKYDGILPAETIEKGWEMLKNPPKQDQLGTPDLKDCQKTVEEEKELQEKIKDGTVTYCPDHDSYFLTKDPEEPTLSAETRCAIHDTWLYRHDKPGKEDDNPDLLRRLLRKGLYSEEKMNRTDYVKVMEAAVHLWPESHYSHQGLAQVLAEEFWEHGDFIAGQQAVKEYLKTVEIMLSKGKHVYEALAATIPSLISDVENKAALDYYYELSFKYIPEGSGRYLRYRDYAVALAKLGDKRADDYYRKALKVAPEGLEGVVYESYSLYLVNHNRAQEALDMLAPTSKAQKVMHKNAFHGTRCQALMKLGRKTEAVAECPSINQIQSLPSPLPSQDDIGGGTPEPMKIEPESHLWSGMRLFARWFGASPVYANHTVGNPSKSCKLNNPIPNCQLHPNDPSGRCYFYHIWNLAELIDNESLLEQNYGARVQVAWTVRNRVTRGAVPPGTVGCSFPGVSGGCTDYCPATPGTLTCTLQKRYCCVVRTGAFAYFHRDEVSPTAIEIAHRVTRGDISEPMTGFIPPGTTGCGAQFACNEDLKCDLTPQGAESNITSYHQDGSIYFYSDSVSNLKCRGFQKGTEVSDGSKDYKCASVVGDVCGDTPNGGPPRYTDDADNCFSRAMRIRPYMAGSDFVPSDPSQVIRAGNFWQIPAGTYIYRVDPDPPRTGGKQLTVKIQGAGSSGKADVRVIYTNTPYNITVYDLGVRVVDSNSLDKKYYTSNDPVSDLGNVIIISNEGPRTIYVEAVEVRD